MREKQNNYATRLTIVMGVPTIFGVYSLIRSLADSVFIATLIVIIILISLLYFPIEKFIDYLSNIALQKVVHFIKLPFVFLISILLIVGVAFSSLNVGRLKNFSLN